MCIMNHSQSQDREFEERRNHAEHSIDLINALKQRVSQLVERYYQGSSQSPESQKKLLELLLKELLELADKAVASVQHDLEARGKSLLPALRSNPTQLLLSAIEELNTADLEDYVRENFSAEQYEEIHKVYGVIRRSIRNLTQQARLSPDEVVQRFNDMKQQYASDHEQQLSYFREECGDSRDDRQCLNDRYQDNAAVQIWLRYDMDITRTIDEMSRLGYEEKELLDLFAYIVRAEILHEVDHEARQLLNAQDQRVPSDEKVKAALLEVMVKINKSRHWYCIYMTLVKVGKIDKGDFNGFKHYITSLIGKTNPQINTRDLSAKMDGDVFSKKGSIFDHYQNLSTEFLNRIVESQRQVP